LLPSNTIANPRGDLKAITTRSVVAYDGPMIPPTPSPPPKEVERKTEPDVAPNPNPKPLIHYPLRLNDQKLCEKTNSQMLKFLQIFQRLHFDLSFADALLHIPNFTSMFKSLLSNKEKIFELANTPLNENCSAKLSLPDLTPTRMTLELATRSIAYPTERPFLRMAHDLVDVYEEELILRDDDEKLIFHADSTSKHPHKHGNQSVNMINFIYITCEDRFLKVLKIKKSNHPSSGSTTPLLDSSPSLTPFETSDSLFEEFADELALLDPFPPENEDLILKLTLEKLNIC
nr:hypothetical protein [Tanacetum cinerariifolium]